MINIFSYETGTKEPIRGYDILNWTENERVLSRDESCHKRVPVGSTVWNPYSYQVTQSARARICYIKFILWTFIVMGTVSSKNDATTDDKLILTSRRKCATTLSALQGCRKANSDKDSACKNLEVRLVSCWAEDHCKEHADEHRRWWMAQLCSFILLTSEPWIPVCTCVERDDWQDTIHGIIIRYPGLVLKKYHMSLRTQCQYYCSIAVYR